MWQGGLVALADGRTPPPPSRAPAIRAGLLALAFVAVLSLLLATFTDVVTVRFSHSDTIADMGYDRHGPALLLLAFAIGALAVLAYRGTRAAAAGVAFLGLVCLLIAIAGDVPDLSRTVQAGPAAAEAASSAGAGFYFETLGGMLALLAGVGLWVMPKGAASTGHEVDSAPREDEPDWDLDDQPIAPRHT